jgi:hypothetical protein
MIQENLPSRRTFLVRFSNTAAPGAGIHRGRIEHIPTGRTARFTSLQDFDKFVENILADENGQYPGNNQVTPENGDTPCL